MADAYVYEVYPKYKPNDPIIGYLGTDQAIDAYTEDRLFKQWKKDERNGYSLAESLESTAKSEGFKAIFYLEGETEYVYDDFQTGDVDFDVDPIEV